MLKRLRKTTKVLKQYSHIQIFRIFVLILRNYLYFICFRLKKWHISNIRYFRQYQESSLRILDFLNPKIVIEFGCGLGEVSRNINNLERLILIDEDPQIIKILKLFKRKNETIAQFDFCDSSSVVSYLKSIGIAKIDALVALNFLHQLDKQDIVDALALYHDLLEIEYVLIDLAVEGESGFRHPLSLANEIGTIIEFYEIEEKFTQDNFRWGLCLLKLDSRYPGSKSK